MTPLRLTAMVGIIATVAFTSLVFKGTLDTFVAEESDIANLRALEIERLIENEARWLSAIAAFFTASLDVDPQEFATFIDNTPLRSNPDAQVFWAPRIDSGGFVVQQGPHGSAVPVPTQRDAPLATAEPESSYLVAYTYHDDIDLFGTNIFESPALMPIFQRARLTGELVVTPDVPLGEYSKRHTVIALPVYTTTAGLETTPIGYLFSVIDLSGIIETYLRNTRPAGHHVLLYNDDLMSASRTAALAYDALHGTSPSVRLLYKHISRAGYDKRGYIEQLASLLDIQFTSSISVGAQFWSVVSIPTSEKLQQAFSLPVTSAVAGGFLATLLVCGFVQRGVTHTKNIANLNKSLETEKSDLAQAVMHRDRSIQQLQNSERKFRDLTDGSVQGILIHRRGKPLFVNQAFADMFEFDSPSDVLMLDNCERLIEPDSRELVGRLSADCLKGRPLPAQVRVGAIRQRGGNSLFLELTYRRVEWEGEPAVQITMIDVTEKIEAERTLKQNERIQTAVQLTGGVAHDFNNILGIITGAAGLLEQGLADQPKLARRVALIRQAAQRGSKLNSRLLDFARQGNSKNEAESISGLLSDTAELLAIADIGNVDIEYCLADGLWSSAIDKDDFQDALINLVFNARDAMDGEGKLRITAHNQSVTGNKDVAAGDYVKIAVQDWGCGMTRETMDRVFEPFYTTKERGKGTGLGMSSLYGFVRRSAGHIQIESAVGQGTTVSLLLPRSIEIPGQPANRNDPQQAPGVPQDGATILVVDDEEVLLDIVVEQLTGLGHHVLRATNATEALETLEGEPGVDLLFSDIIMPGGMTGLQLAHEVRRRMPEVAILLASGFTGKFSHEPADQVFLNTLLNKPYKLADLVTAIKRALADRGAPGDEAPRASIEAA